VTGKALAGFQLGLSTDVPLEKDLSFRPKLQYAYEGYQPDIDGDHVNVRVAYLGTPLDIVYHTHLLQRRFFAGAGPYFAYAMNGTYTFKGINTDMRFGNNYYAGDNLRKTDYGVDLIAGLLLDRNFVLGTQFDLGLRNIDPSGASTPIHTRSAGVSLTYVFRD
jgi:hypothetical protein